ncbi:MAG: hypothetical protein ACOY4M_08300 [Pseudomonadota bacterium]
MSALQDKADMQSTALPTDEMEIVEFTPADRDDETRIELRRGKNGTLRGIVWRRRGKDRKAIYYVGAKSKGDRGRQWEELRQIFG